MHPVRRWLLTRVPLCILLGLLTTIAVSWSFAAFGPIRNGLVDLYAITGVSPSAHMEVTTARRAGSMRRYLGPGRAGTIGHTILFHSDMRVSPVPSTYFDSSWGDMPATAFLDPAAIAPRTSMEDARGWPCLALWCSFTVPVTGRARAAITTADAITLTPGETDYAAFRALPLRPIPRGLILNALFYAALWLLALAAIGFTPLRRTLRRRRGQCPACAYDLRGLSTNAPCPECGSQSSNLKAKSSNVPTPI